MIKNVIVVIAVFINEHACELGNIIFQGIFQDICCPGVCQFKHTLYQVWNIYLVGSRECDNHMCLYENLCHLSRVFRLVLCTFWQDLEFCVQNFLYIFLQLVYVASHVLKCIYEFILLH